MRNVEVHSCPELMGLIQEVGFLPLLDSGIAAGGRLRLWQVLCGQGGVRQP